MSLARHFLCPLCAKHPMSDQYCQPQPSSGVQETSLLVKSKQLETWGGAPQGRCVLPRTLRQEESLLGQMLCCCSRSGVHRPLCVRLHLHQAGVELRPQSSKFVRVEVVEAVELIACGDNIDLMVMEWDIPTK